LGVYILGLRSFIQYHFFFTTTFQHVDMAMKWSYIVMHLHSYMDEDIINTIIWNVSKNISIVGDKISLL
jgi:hypothetical protein